MNDILDEIPEKIKREFQLRNRQWPTAYEGLLWIAAELAEAIEESMGKEPKWVRNNPLAHSGKYSPEKFAEELGDIIYMSLVTAITVGAPNPLKAMVTKLEKHIEQEEANDYSKM